jgi:hypothetical protein
MENRMHSLEVWYAKMHGKLMYKSTTKEKMSYTT